MAEAVGSEVAVAVTPGAPVAAPPVEPVTAPPVEPVKPADRTAERFAALARKERGLVERQLAERAKLTAAQQTLARERAAMEAQRQEFEASVTKRATDAARDAALANPETYLSQIYGQDWYDRLTKAKLDGIPTTADLQVKSVKEELRGEVEALRKEQREYQARIAAERKQAAEAQIAEARKEAEEVISTFEKESVDFVKQNAAKYELTSLYDQAHLVPQVIQETFRVSSEAGSPRVLSYEEAAQQVEEYMAEQVKRYEDLKARKAPKVGDAVKPASTSPTLTNATGSSPSMPSEYVSSSSSKDPRMAKALAAWERTQKR